MQCINSTFVLVHWYEKTETGNQWLWKNWKMFFESLSLRNPEFMNSVSIMTINDLVDATTLANLLKYDSAYGRFDGRVVTKVQNDSDNGNKNVSIILNETIEIKILSERKLSGFTTMEGIGNRYCIGVLDFKYLLIARM